ncbi:MAG: hypothetical protein AAF436_15515 [Myxococcota bacterium]
MNTTAARSLALVTLVCCAAPSGPARPIELILSSRSDVGDLLTGTRISIDGTHQGTSVAGELRTTVPWSASTSRTIRITYGCPEGYREARGPITLQVRPFRSLEEAGSEALEVFLPCALVAHVAAIVVRVREPRSIPILLGQEKVAETDTEGLAVFTRRLPPNALFEVTLSTEAFPDLRPASPTRSFVAGDAHEVFFYDQAFSVTPRPVRKRFRPARIVKIE